MGKKTRTKELAKLAHEERFLRVFSEHAKSLSETLAKPEPPILDEFSDFKERFVRPPESFVSLLKTSDRSKRSAEMARHLFSRFKVPPVLSSVWDERRRIDESVRLWRQWHVTVATGGSFLKEHAKGMLTRKEAHCFLACKHRMRVNQALVFAVASCAGASDGIALRIARSKLSDMPFDDFWRDCLRFLSANPPPSIREADDLCDYLRAKRAANNAFSILGQGNTFESLRRRMIEWHHELARHKAMGNHSWEGADVPDCTVDAVDHKTGQKIVWTFHQIKDTKELAAEGTRMRHCVFSYRDRCVSGACSIWSLLKRNGEFGVDEHKITIELSKDLEIVQARGLANRAVRNDESAAISAWGAKTGIRPSNRQYGL